MSQTVKFARHRAMQDPDRGDNDGYGNAGVYFGSNIPYPVLAEKPHVRGQRTTRGACVSGEDVQQ